MKLLYTALVVFFISFIYQANAGLVRRTLFKRHFDEDASELDKYEKSHKHIEFQGGPVMTNPLKIVLIFYGKHEQKTIDLLKFFVQNLGKSEWWAVTRTYTDENKIPISDNVTLSGVWFDDYSHGKKWKEPEEVLKHNLMKNKAVEDPDTIYSLILAKDVEAMEFCQHYCGVHKRYDNQQYQIIKYAIVTDVTSCPGTAPPPGMEKGTKGCLQKPWRNTTMSLNGDQSADGMISIFAHELSETVTDPLSPDGWTDGRKRSYENGDKCNQKFGELKYETINGQEVAYNTMMGPPGQQKKFLIQQMWSARTQRCELKDDPSAKPEDEDDEKT